jgi:hypothetical protein
MPKLGLDLFGGSGHTALTGIIKNLVVLSSNAMFFKDSRVLSKLFLFLSLKIIKYRNICNWAQHSSYLFLAVQVHTTTYYRFYREQHWAPHLLRQTLHIAISIHLKSGCTEIVICY